MPWSLHLLNEQDQRAWMLEHLNLGTGADWARGGISFSPGQGGVIDIGYPLSERTHLGGHYRVRWQVADHDIYVVDDIPVATLIPKDVLDRQRGPGAMPLEIQFAMLPQGRLRFAWRVCQTRSCADGWTRRFDGEHIFEGRPARPDELGAGEVRSR